MEGIEKICVTCKCTIPCNKKDVIKSVTRDCTTYKCINYIKDSNKIKKLL